MASTTTYTSPKAVTCSSCSLLSRVLLFSAIIYTTIVVLAPISGLGPLLALASSVQHRQALGPGSLGVGALPGDGVVEAIINGDKAPVNPGYVAKLFFPDGGQCTGSLIARGTRARRACGPARC